MEYVDGTPLLETASTLERRDQIETIARVCDAAHEAHRHGIVHRDLKPGNILLRRSSDPGSPEPVILDFGVGKALAEAGRNASMETEAGQLVGTLAYMSPEQFSGKAVDARVDVYAIGVILYELLSGQKPHETGASLAESARLAAARRAPSLRRVLPAASVDLEAVVARALEPDPARRFASAGELAEDLRPVLQARPVSARKWTAMYRAERFARRHRTPLLAGVVLAIIACAAVLGRSWGSSGWGQQRSNWTTWPAPVAWRTTSPLSSRPTRPSAPRTLPTPAPSSKRFRRTFAPGSGGTWTAWPAEPRPSSPIPSETLPYV